MPVTERGFRLAVYAVHARFNYSTDACGVEELYSHVVGVV